MKYAIQIMVPSTTAIATARDAIQQLDWAMRAPQGSTEVFAVEGMPDHVFVKFIRDLQADAPAIADFLSEGIKLTPAQAASRVHGIRVDAFIAYLGTSCRHPEFLADVVRELILCAADVRFQPKAEVKS